MLIGTESEGDRIDTNRQEQFIDNLKFRLGPKSRAIITTALLWLSQTDRLHSPYPVLLYGPPSFVMCDESHDSNILPTTYPITSLFEGSSQEIEKIEIERKHIVGNYLIPLIDSDSGDVLHGATNVLLVPVGYEDIERKLRMKSHLSRLEKVYKGVDIGISYIDKPVPISIKEQNGKVYYDPDINSNELRILLARVKQQTGLDFDAIAVLVNSPLKPQKVSWSMRGLNPFSYIFPETLGGDFILAHEIGHLVGLDDGYFTNIPQDYLAVNTEFTIDPTRSEGTVHKIWSNLDKQKRPPIVPTGAICQGYIVYRYRPDGVNLMGDTLHNDPYRDILNAGSADILLTPFQKMVINSIAAENANR